MTPSEEVRELILSRTDLLEKPCSRYNDMPDTFNPYEEIKKRGKYFGDVCWLIINGHACQTEDWYDYFKSLRPTAGCVSLLAEQCSAFAEWNKEQIGEENERNERF